jgi:ankyrin repeat protein
MTLRLHYNIISHPASILVFICCLQISPKPTRVTLGDVNAHYAAADGMLELLKELAAKDRSLLFKPDHNGWRPLHEAARGGHAEVVKYLLQEGAQVNERTNDGDGASPLFWAEKRAKGRDNAKAIAVLKAHGGVSLLPLPVAERKLNKKSEESSTK